MKPQARKHEHWFDLIAGTATVIGILGLMFILAQSLLGKAWAQPADEGNGFKPGARNFSNPFAPGGNKPGNFFDDEEEDDEFQNFGGGFPPAPVGDDTAGGGRSASGPTGGDSKGVSMGGSRDGGVISKNKVKALPVDDESADGSKEVVTDFNFPDADIMDIAKTLGKLTGKNFILDKDVKGKITIISNSPITVGDAWKAFLTSLDINGFALIPSGKYIRIARQRDARDKQLKTFTGDYSPDTDALITRVFPLKYLSADEVARNFRSFMPANSRIIPYDQTNTVIVTDTGSNIQKLQKLLEILDVEGYDAGIEVIPVKYASAAEFSKLIDSLIPGTPAGGPSGGAAGAPRFGGGAGGRFAARRTKEGGIINTIIADERTNTLIVHANGKGADQVRELVAKLDQRQPSNVGGGRVHVVYLQFADAEQIGNTLNNLTQQSGGGRPGGGIGGGTGTGTNPQQQSLFEGAIKVAPDKSTNALVVTASPQDFVTVQRVINRLDIPRDQVYAEVVIMEVSLGNNFNFSANIALPTSGIASLPNKDAFIQFLGSGRVVGDGAVLGFSGGKTTEITVGNQKFSVGTVEALVQAIQSTGYANVLATPQILTLDNTEATFESAETIPVLTQTSIQGAGVATGTTDKRISLMITLKPQINKLSNFVKLDVQAKLADRSGRPVPSAVENLAFGTVERVAKTSIVVADKDTVVLGGLTRDDVRDNISKVPILGDIPLLGWLFRSKRSETAKSNLLLFITPKIIRQYESIRAVLDKKLEERDKFLEENAGGKDVARRYRDRMIKQLPEIDEITSYKAQNISEIDPLKSKQQIEAPETAPNPPGQ